MLKTVKSIGRVKWFNDAQGFGVIIDSGSGNEIFVHYSAICDLNQHSLEEGWLVKYEAFESARGLQAANVRKLKG